jgi:hypothetical protein
VRQRTVRAGLLNRWSIPGWLLLALSVPIKLVDWASRVDFVERQIAERTGVNVDYVAALRDWGPLVGVIWLVGLVVLRNRGEKAMAENDGRRTRAIDITNSRDISFTNVEITGFDEGIRADDVTGLRGEDVRISGPSSPPAAGASGKVIRIADLSLDQGVLRGRTFEDKVIVGPAMFVFSGAVTFDSCKFGGAREDVVVEVPVGRRRVVGAIGLKDCVFRRCRTVNIGLLLTDQQARLFDS